MSRGANSRVQKGLGGREIWQLPAEKKVGLCGNASERRVDTLFSATSDP